VKVALLLGAVGIALGFAAMGQGMASRPAPAYSVVERLSIGGEGGWDFIAVDEKRHRLYVSRGELVQVVDAESGKVIADIPGTHGVHGIAIAEEFGLGFTSNGRSNSVTVFDLETEAVVDTVEVTGSNPDAILYDPYSKHILTFNGKSSNVTAIDVRTRKVVGTLALPGKPEVAVSDGAGHVYVNIEDRNSLASIEMPRLALSAEWPLGKCDGPTGLAIDDDRKRLFSVCHSKEMVVVDARSGKLLQELPIGAEVDGAEFDPQLQLAFSSNGEGTMTVVNCTGPQGCGVVASVPTQSRARTLALDRSTHRIYLPTASFGPLPPATTAQPKPRAPMVAGSFVVLVLAPFTPRQ
jgi:YVTN family beta-propeller protein